MPIVSSVIQEDSTQGDVHRWITEFHTDDKGVVHRMFYMVDAGVDVDVTLARNAARIEEQMATDAAERRLDNFYQQSVGKVNSYLRGLTAAERKTAIGLTDAEDDQLFERGV